MDLSGAKILVCGATGVLGRGLTGALLARGASVVPAGRDADRLAELGETCGTVPLTFEAADAASCAAMVDAAAAGLGGLDAIIITVGVAAFGPAADADPELVQELFAVNTFGPMVLARAALPHLSEHGTVVVLSAILADLPTAGMGEYSASKAAISSWLSVLRREIRPQIVLDVRPPHLDTGLENRALAGAPRKLPAPMPAGDVVELILAALEGGKKEIVWDQQSKSLLAR
ncbi:SDR family NAD(P)-dependent oxidoreductase [Nakamurella sp. A5-74]|uniref:SDR family NAD(P)-dependent oxidoreductase n=1 Tax=Nakamurella sp. A5-74 TaxID=3158264 RepID=A0AAU8DIF6_9ACTN